MVNQYTLEVQVRTTANGSQVEGAIQKGDLRPAGHQ